MQSLWSDWSSCEPYCDGVQKRTRTVLVQAAGGKACGAPLELRECNNSCVDCRWSDWMDASQHRQLRNSGDHPRLLDVCLCFVGIDKEIHRSPLRIQVVSTPRPGATAMPPATVAHARACATWRSPRWGRRPSAEDGHMALGELTSVHRSQEGVPGLQHDELPRGLPTQRLEQVVPLRALLWIPQVRHVKPENRLLDGTNCC